MQDDVDGGNGSLLVGAVGHFYFAQIGHFYFAATWQRRVVSKKSGKEESVFLVCWCRGTIVARSDEDLLALEFSPPFSLRVADALSGQVPSPRFRGARMLHAGHNALQVYARAGSARA